MFYFQKYSAAISLANFSVSFKSFNSSQHVLGFNFLYSRILIQHIPVSNPPITAIPFLILHAP